MSDAPAVFTRAPYTVVCRTCADYLASVGLPATAEQINRHEVNRRSRCPKCKAMPLTCDRCRRPAPADRRCPNCHWAAEDRP